MGKQSTGEETMTTQLYLHRGWRRNSNNNKGFEVAVILEGDDAAERFKLADQIAGSEYTLPVAAPISVAVPPPLRGVLLDLAELYKQVPELNPKRRRRRKT
jgi:hypothetical protein